MVVLSELNALCLCGSPIRTFKDLPLQSIAGNFLESTDKIKPTNYFGKPYRFECKRVHANYATFLYTLRADEGQKVLDDIK